MADAEWPSTVPSEPEVSSYREAVISGISSFKPDVGPAMTRRASILDAILVQASFVLHSDTERDNFKTFFRSTLQDGVRPFVWDNPAHDVAGRYVMDAENPPQLTHIGAQRWRLALSMIKIGEAPPLPPTFDSTLVTFDSTLATWDIA